MAPLPKVQPLPGDVLRRSPKRPPEVFEDLLLFLKGQKGQKASPGDLSVLNLVEHNSWLEVDVMLEFVVLQAVVKVCEDEESTVVYFTDMLGQDSIRFGKFVRAVDRSLSGFAQSQQRFYMDFDDEDDREEVPEDKAMETALALMKSCLDAQKSAADNAQILAFWAFTNPSARAAIAQAAVHWDVVQALTQQTKESDVALPQVHPLVAALRQSEYLPANDLAKYCNKDFEVRAQLADLPGIRKYGGYTTCQSEDLPKSPSDDGTATASPVSQVSQNRRPCSDVLSSD
mmetsp:Transcript_14850/g.27843  ORF Transcript_14850/g.27843 Transcript_14850/m.27843 type:complete len:287 (+) Transcript_14850:51-911(+)